MTRPVAATILALLIYALAPAGAVPGPPTGFPSAPRQASVVGAEFRLAGGRFEASGAAVVPDTPGILFVDDDRTREVMWLPFSATGQAGAPRPLRLPSDVVDPEGMTFDGRFHYIVGSQSKRNGTRGDGLVRFRFDPRSHRIEHTERVQGLRAFLGRHVAQLAGVERQSGDRSLNIEAIAWDPAGERWLLGLRAPLINGYALVVPLELADPQAGLTAANLRVPGGRAFEVPLDGAGIRSLEYDESASAFRVITGAPFNEERLAFRLYSWQGPERPGSLVLERTFPAGTKPEGITRIRLNGRTRTVVVYDGSGYLVLD